MYKHMKTYNMHKICGGGQFVLVPGPYHKGHRADSWDICIFIAKYTLFIKSLLSARRLLRAYITQIHNRP